MSIRAVIRRCERVLSVYHDLGLRETLRRLRHRLYQISGRRDSRYQDWEIVKEKCDLDFDMALGVQTGGVQELFELTTVGSNAKHGLSHIATDPSEFESAIRNLEPDLDRFSFIDFGSGKGRALMLARAFPFKRIIGVEFAQELHQSAQDNFRKLSESGQADDRIELIWADATEFPVPDGPLLAYLFNPFGSVIVTKLARHLRHAWETQKRDIVICYMNPVHSDCFTREGWKLVLDKGFVHFISLEERLQISPRETAQV